MTIKRGDRIQVTSDLVRRKCIPENWPNKTKFYGTIVGDESTKGWIILIDLFPVDFKNIYKR